MSKVFDALRDRISRRIACTELEEAILLEVAVRGGQTTESDIVAKRPRARPAIDRLVRRGTLRWGGSETLVMTSAVRDRLEELRH